MNSYEGRKHAERADRTRFDRFTHPGDASLVNPSDTKGMASATYTPPKEGTMLVKHTNGLVTFEIEDGSALAKSILVKRAAEMLAQWPQYAGYHEDASWSVARVKRTIKARGRVIAYQGDLVLTQAVDPAEVAAGIRSEGFSTIFSWETGHHISVADKNLVAA